MPVDIHADLADDTSDPRYALAEHIADRTRAHGMGGRVTVGHMTSLASLVPDARKRVLGRARRRRRRGGRAPDDRHAPGRAGTTRRTSAAGSPRSARCSTPGSAPGSRRTTSATRFTPYGVADVLDVALFLAQTSHLAGPDDLAGLVRMATDDAAAIVGRDDRHGLHVGADADLVVLAAPTATEALLARAHRRVVIKRGRVVATTERTVQLHRRR